MYMKFIAGLAICMLLGACGGSGSGSTSGGSSGSGSTSGDSSGSVVGRPGFSLAVTDAPIDGVVAVVLQFTEVRLRRADGAWIDFPLETPKSIDLLQLQGNRSEDLLSDVTLPIGQYDEIRLILDAAPMTNYVDPGGDDLEELIIPSGTSSGLKIKGDFSWLSTGAMTMVIDFDLRQSIKLAGNSGRYMMQPVVRLVNADEAGLLRGQVSVTRLTTMPDCSDNLVDTFNAVYVFAGHNVIPEDIDHSSELDVDPVATTTISYVPLTAAYEYEAAFLPAGDYTIALTCNADLDDLDRGGDDLKFFIVRNVTVTAR